ncbi:hypothetical protein [Acetobacter sp. AAB5]|uniref:hypothetical protein n=1 Tax=Acetobacter sp. AAB5 TaxID=3418370 RepID=UPI003CF7D66C
MPTLLDFTAGVATGAGGNTLSGGQIVDAVTSGPPVVVHVNPDTSLALSFSGCGRIAHRVLPVQDTEISIIGGVSGLFQEMLVMVQQSAMGNAVVALPSGIVWQGAAPFIDIRAGAVTFFRLWTLDGGNTIYGKSI